MHQLLQIKRTVNILDETCRVFGISVIRAAVSGGFGFAEAQIEGLENTELRPLKVRRKTSAVFFTVPVYKDQQEQFHTVLRRKATATVSRT